MSYSAPPVSTNERPFGGQYAPESLIESLEGLQDMFEFCWNDVGFQEEFNHYLALIRSPSPPLHVAWGLSVLGNGAQIYLRREDANHVHSHFIFNALGQALIARRLGKSTILAETGSGNHGIAVAAVCQMLGLDCIVYMGAKDAKGRTDQVRRMQGLGTKVVEVSRGSGTIREATTEVLRAVVEKHETAYPLLGGAYGPRPLPMIVNAFQRMLGDGVKIEMLMKTSKLPDAVVACAGIHGPAVGLFDTFLPNKDVKLVAVEAGGHGLNTNVHAAVLTCGTPGVYHGAHTLVLQDVHGQIEQARSIAPDLSYPGTSPWLAQWTKEGRVQTMEILDEEAELGCAILSFLENIGCSIEDGHAIAAGLQIAAKMSINEKIVICIGGGT